MVSGYPTSTSFPRVDDWSMDPRVLGRHKHNLIKIIICKANKQHMSLHWARESSSSLMDAHVSIL